MQTSGTLSQEKAKSTVIAVIQPRFGWGLSLAVLSWQEISCKELGPQAKRWWPLAPPFQNHSQFTHQFHTACSAPLPGSFPLYPRSSHVAFPDHSAHSEFSQLSLQAPGALGHGPAHPAPCSNRWIPTLQSRHQPPPEHLHSWRQTRLHEDGEGLAGKFWLTAVGVCGPRSRQSPLC